MDLLDEVTLAIIDIYDDVEEIGVSRGQAKLMLRRAVETAAAVLDELDEEEAETIVSISDSNALLAKALRKGHPDNAKVHRRRIRGGPEHVRTRRRQERPRT